MGEYRPERRWGILDRTLLCTSSFVDVIDKIIGVDHWLFSRFSAGKMK